MRIKIGDFGVSKHIPVDSTTVLRTDVGTAHYRAPEVGDSKYTSTVDCWSVGCIVYRLIVGRDLFKDLHAVYKFVYTGVPSPVSALVAMDWGDDGPDFVGKLITVDPDRRLHAAAALDHSWMLRFSGADNNHKYTINTNLRTRFEAMIDNRKDRETLVSNRELIRMFEAYILESPPKWNFQTHIGTGDFAKVYLESITLPVFGKQLCVVKRIHKENVRLPRKICERQIEILSKLKQVRIF